MGKQRHRDIAGDCWPSLLFLALPCAWGTLTSPQFYEPTPARLGLSRGKARPEKVRETYAESITPRPIWGIGLGVPGPYRFRRLGLERRDPFRVQPCLLWPPLLPLLETPGASLNQPWSPCFHSPAETLWGEPTARPGPLG